MEERVIRRLAAFVALFEVKPGIEIAMRVAPLARAFLQVMDQRIYVALCDIRIGRQVIFRVEKPGFFSDLVVAEKRCHAVPA